jgi:hypothetical protein
MELEKLSLTILLSKIGNTTRLTITPFFWVILFSLRREYTGMSGNHITIRKVMQSPTSIDFKSIQVPRKYLRKYVFSWLCFDLEFHRWKLTEAGNIFPSNYDYTKVSTETEYENFYKLEQTGFFYE